MSDEASCILCDKPTTSEQDTADWVIRDGAHRTCVEKIVGIA